MGVSSLAELDAEVRYVTAEGEPVVTSLREVAPDRVVWGAPVRRVQSRAGQRHYSGLFWSATNREHVVYESRLELDRLWLADFDPCVSRIAAQPFWVSGFDAGILRRHVPDLMLRLPSGGVMVVDVKPAVFVDDPAVAPVLAWTGRLCAARGWSYEVWTGAGVGPELANLRWLGRVRRPGLVSEDAITSALASARAGITIGELTDALERRCGPAQAAAAVMFTLWSGHMSTDLSQPLSRESVLECG